MPVDVFAVFLAARLSADAKGTHGLTRLDFREMRGAEEKFPLGAAVANLVLLARPDDRSTRTRGPPPAPAPERIDRIAQISRSRYEQSYQR